MKKIVFVFYPLSLLLVLFSLLWFGEQLLAEEQAVPFASTVELELLADGFTQPLGLVATGIAEDERLFVLEKNGRVKILHQDGTVEPDPFLSIGHLLSFESERGLLGLAFDPDYAINGYFYINYTRAHEDEELKGDTVIARYQVQSENPNVADPNSSEILLIVPQDFANHNGGDLQFGPEDGYLYIMLGDGGSRDDPNDRGQALDNMLGTILRIDVHSTGGAGACGTAENYGIPADNPFVDVAGACSEIWAYGLRNPWRVSFDRLTNDLFIADVGQDAREEINLQPHDSAGGENYGWRCYEGTLPANLNDCPPENTLTFPILEYPHPSGMSVTGGYVYRGSLYPNLYGAYFYGDFVTGAMWLARPSSDGNDVTWEASQIEEIPTLSISSFGQDNAGELYVVDFDWSSEGAVYRLLSTDTAVVDLRFEKRGPNFALAGEPFTYTLEVENIGNTAVSNLVITDRVPLGATFIAANGTLENGVVRWESPELLPNGLLTLTMSVSATQTVVNDDYVLTADGLDPIPGTQAILTIVSTQIQQLFLPFISRP